MQKITAGRSIHSYAENAEILCISYCQTMHFSRIIIIRVKILLYFIEYLTCRWWARCSRAGWILWDFDKDILRIWSRKSRLQKKWRWSHFHTFHAFCLHPSVHLPNSARQLFNCSAAVLLRAIFDKCPLASFN